MANSDSERLLFSYPLFTSQQSVKCLPRQGKRIKRERPPEWQLVGFGCLADVLEKFKRNAVQIQSRGNTGGSCWQVRSMHPNSSSLPLLIILLSPEAK